MTPEAFARWLAEMKAAGLAKSDRDAAALLGVSANSIVSMKRSGVTGATAERTALACQALLDGLKPYQ
ncbi:hypothetical protein [Paracoccus denitrificans]|jgi:putative heme degradation protein|uniref:XRE family transcriptional regulator n=1 Tax=Paracoccus denitrificans (strain Pd 1222) TaxID=318586 RepID=A1AZ03_PARDP|nr:hypothetical protein [Paracoccus denitrificans]ABL68497.1 hypothetical protein Pden_0383 [Paracoccus denitrificans PD1222]MBB4625781.1 putative heme degradation protein [Paracoccus denitrificans]MCU7427054.1 hypothetical protein [Paracoccus denitrificans]QAR26571.1 hypothetical protein EO213_09830 [Paracoccus denitrificans]UFS65263.1 hypothetical protein LO749_01465 [Paracoccus denitrificans]